MSSTCPFIVIVPGGSQNPAHYAYLTHLLLLSGYPVFSAPLPSVGATGNVTVADEAEFIRNKMLLPVLDIEERNVVLLMHSYSSVPGSVAASGLGTGERAAQGKKTAVIGQVCVAALLVKGGDGKDLVAAYGGAYPPHVRPDNEFNLLRWNDRIGPLYHDVVPAELAETLAASSVPQCLGSFTSPVPRASWDAEDFKGRVAFIRAINDAGIPLQIQQMMIDGSGEDWIIRDMESGHSPNVSQPEKLVEILVDLVKLFETK